MRLTSELTVDAPLERTWPAVLELGGPVSVDLGAEYEGAARLDDVDEDEHAAGFHAHAREAAGHGLVTATIAARLSASDAGTRVAVETDLWLTGAAARPGQEQLQRATDELLARLAAALLREPDAPVVAPPAPTRSESPQLKRTDPLVLVGKVAERALLVAAGVALGLAVGKLLWRRR